MNKKRMIVILLALAVVLAFTLTACDPAAASISAISLDKNATTLEVGQTFTINVTLEGELGENEIIKWLSSDAEVVSVEPNATGVSCVITAVAKGTATLTVSYNKEVKVTATVTVNDTAGDLVAAKSAKKAALDNLVLDYTEADFSPANWTTLMGYISAAKTAVDNSTTIAAIAEIVVADVKVDCDAVLTEAEEEAQALAAAKVAKKAELDNLAQDYSEEDYSPATWTTLTGYISTAKTAVDNCTTIAAVAEIVVADVKVDCDAVVAYVRTSVATREEFISAIENSDIIELTGNILVDGAYIGDTDIRAYTRDYNLVIDLKGFTYGYEINIATKNGFSATVEIKNGTVGALDIPDLYYGLMINGDNKLSATLTNVNVYGYYGGLYTNGTFEGATIVVNGGNYEGGDAGQDSVGAYLAANYTYTVVGATFTGASAIHIKSGTLTLTNCVLIADGEYAEPAYHGSGANMTGNGLMLEPTVGYFQTLSVTVSGGSITSASGYAIGEHASAAAGVDPVAYGTANIKDDCVLSGLLGDVLSQNDKVTIVA